MNDNSPVSDEKKNSLKAKVVSFYSAVMRTLRDLNQTNSEPKTCAILIHNLGLHSIETLASRSAQRA
jgi:orotate phosphoribosyltransferase-like protein